MQILISGIRNLVWHYLSGFLFLNRVVGNISRFFFHFFSFSRLRQKQGDSFPQVRSISLFRRIRVTSLGIIAYIILYLFVPILYLFWFALPFMVVVSFLFFLAVMITSLLTTSGRIIFSSLFFLLGAVGVLIELSAYRRGRKELLGIKKYYEWNMNRVGSSDPVVSFFKSELGSNVMQALEIDIAAVNDFLDARKKRVARGESCERVSSDNCAVDSALASFEFDDDVKDFLIVCQSSFSELREATMWFLSKSEYEHSFMLWWSMGRLASIPSLDVSSGTTQSQTLSRWSRPLPFLYDRLIPGISHVYVYELRKMELALLGERNHSILLAGGNPETLLEIISQFARRLESGNVDPRLEGAKVCLLSFDALAYMSSDKGMVYAYAYKSIEEASAEGDVILVIDNFARAQNFLSLYGIDFPSLLETALASKSLRVIVTVSGEIPDSAFPKELCERMTAINISAPGEEELMNLFSALAPRLEREYRIAISYLSLKKIALLAKDSETRGSLFDNGVDLLYEVVMRARRAHKTQVTKDDIVQ